MKTSSRLEVHRICQSWLRVCPFPWWPCPWGSYGQVGGIWPCLANKIPSPRCRAGIYTGNLSYRFYKNNLWLAIIPVYLRSKSTHDSLTDGNRTKSFKCKQVQNLQVLLIVYALAHGRRQLPVCC